MAETGGKIYTENEQSLVQSTLVNNSKQMTVEDAPADDYAAVGSEGSDESWGSRTLCADESCIGVIVTLPAMPISSN